MHDIFQPRHEPARSIYDAFQKEATKRNGRSIEDWMHAEREAVLREATIQAARFGLRVPTMEEIVSAERYASGSIDYGSTWAYQVTNAMKSSNVRITGRTRSG